MHFVDFGPIEIRIAEQIGQTLKIMWDQAPSCYNIQGFEFIYSKGWPLAMKRETTFCLVNVINICNNVFSRLFFKTSCILSILLLHFFSWRYSCKIGNVPWGTELGHIKWRWKEHRISTPVTYPVWKWSEQSNS